MVDQSHTNHCTVTYSHNGSLLYLHGHSFVLKVKSKRGVTVLLGFVVHLSKGTGVSDTTQTWKKTIKPSQSTTLSPQTVTESNKPSFFCSVPYVLRP